MPATGEIKEESKLFALLNYEVCRYFIFVVKPVLSNVTQYLFLNYLKVLLSRPPHHIGNPS